jgi:long-chain acyl-CoA synthetase
MTPDLDLRQGDVAALLGSMLRSRLMARGKPEHLFPGTPAPHAGTPMAAALGLGPDEPRATAHDLAAMLCLEPEDLRRVVSGATLDDWAQTALEAWRRRPTEIVFMTSGSTGAPVPCRQKTALLEQEIMAQADIHAGCRRIVALVPRHHIYGFLFTILLPKALNIPVLELAPVPAAISTAGLGPGDLVVAFPLFWKSLADLGRPLPDGLQGVTSTGPCPADSIHALLALGLTRMTEVYGSSETGGLGYRHQPTDAYTLFPFWQQERAIASPPSALRRRMPEGGTTGPYPLPDIVEWEDTRHFRPVRRTDKAVQVAGVNVHPNKIAALLRTHPLVRDCAVRLMRPEEGQRLKAFVVGRGGTDPAALRRKLKAWAGDRLSAAELPKSWTFGPALPVNSLGKASDWDVEQG